ncbi:MAG TPA: response regulator [Saprospiraceae bacterium]|nr:response regulator [Saprospiraceae bacterium]
MLLIPFFATATEYQHTFPADTLLEKARTMVETEEEGALPLLEEAIALFEAQKNKPKVLAAYELIRDYCYRMPFPFPVKDSIFQKNAQELSLLGDTSQLAHLYLKWSDVAQEVDYRMSQEKVVFADKLFHAVNDSIGMIECQYRFAVLQGSMGNTDLVLPHFEEALQWSKDIQSDAYIAESSCRLGEYYFRTNQPDTALYFINQVLAIAPKAKANTLINAYRIKGFISAASNLLEEAFSYFQKAIELAIEQKDDVRTAMLYIDLGQVHINHTDDILQALDWLKKGLEMAETAGSKRFIKSAHLGLSYTYELLEDFENALFHQRAFTSLQQEMQNEQARNQMLQLEAQYESEKKTNELLKKEAALAKQELKNRTLGAALLLLLFLLAMAVGAWYLKNQSNRHLAEKNQLIQQQADALKSLDEFKSRLFANISHELRTPLTLLLGPVSSVLRRNQVDTEDQQHLHRVADNAQLLLARVNELLDLSKLESGKMELQEHYLELNGYLLDKIDAFLPLASEKQIELQFDDQLPKQTAISIDEDKFGKIIGNLLSNAIKFTPNGGQVKLSAAIQGLHLVLSVQDNGSGIHPDDQKHIFERFYQARHADIRPGGTGLGLSLSQEFAQLMGGGIAVDSTLGQGSIFRLKLPLKRMEAHSQNMDDASLEFEPPVLTQTSGSRLLIVEDNESLRVYLQTILGKHYQVRTCQHGKEALAELKRNPDGFDLILSDIMMPEMDGFQLLEALKGNHSWQHLPVVMLTAKAAQKDKLKALRIGVDDYILKPFQEEELLLRLANVLRHYQLRQDPTPPEEEEAIADHEPEPHSATHDAELTPENQDWLEQLENATIELLQVHLTAESLAAEMAISRRNLFRKVKSLTGLTPNQYIQEVRFQHARQLLESRSVSSVKAVSYEVGMKDIRYFSQLYKARFGKSPSEYL